MKKMNKLANIGGAIKANKKKIIVIVSMIALLVATGCLNYFLNVKGNTTNPDDSLNVDSTPTFFATYRSDRETIREQEKSYLDEIITSVDSTEEAVSAAESQKLALCAAMETELVLETLIKAKGFEDCVVTISTENVNVVVKDEEVSLEEAAQILDIIVSETDFEAPAVTVIPYV